MNTGPNPNALGVIPRIPHAHMENKAERPLSHVVNLYGHYSADRCPQSATVEEEISHMQGIARFHIGKDWSSDHSGVYGFTMMYTYAIFQSGRLYLVNPESWLLWNTTYGNPWGLATVAILGKGEKPSSAMLAAFKAHLDYMTNRADIPARRAHVWGHGECGLMYGGGPPFGNNTDCPGGLLAFIREYRKGAPMPPPGPQPTNRFFPETGQYISFGFKDFWEANPNALRDWGFPITPEIAETLSDGKSYTVQYFERARFEFHPEAPDPFKVQLGLIGVELKACLMGAAHDGH
jgi:hypothetical protein